MPIYCTHSVSLLICAKKILKHQTTLRPRPHFTHRIGMYGFTHKINTSVVTVLRRSIVEAAGGGVERVQTADSSPLLTTSVNHSVSRDLTTDRVSLS